MIDYRILGPFDVSADRRVTLRDVELTSRRLRNYQYNPVWDFLADQSWVR
jgi:hypothetical protein